ncbi:MAG: protein kinase [Deltaproteobacteria bacterium]|nr:protein kinase [Deltaproteobacteria bacterium]
MKFADLRDEVKAGERSVLLAAPRRFGKTSLLRAVREELATTPEVRTFGPFNPLADREGRALWLQIMGELKAEFAGVIDESLDATGVPKRGAFDDVRKRAFDQGVRSLVVMIDEAQALFRGDRAISMSEALKDRLDYSWGQRTGGQAALQLVLAGTTNLPRLIGDNLRATLKPIEVDRRIDEGQILSLLRGAGDSSSLQTTREARERLAEVSCNILLLSLLVDQVQTVLRREFRTWVTRGDVDSAVKRVLDLSARHGDEDHVWRYVRDILNSSDQIEEWVPRDCHVVALALALAGKRERWKEGRVKEAKRLLSSWAPPGLDVLSERVDEEIKRLEEEDVIDRSASFGWEIFGEMLAARADPQRITDQDRHLAANLAIGRIDLDPGEGEVIGTGSQATVRRMSTAEGPVALRLIDLGQGDARRRFVREVSILQRILGQGSRRLAAHDNLPTLRDAGILQRDPNVGAVIYDWIEGDPLEKDQLETSGAISIGLALSRVLEMLGDAEFVHRDIKPENILITTKVDGSIRAVLIDFGLVAPLKDLARTTAVGTPGFVAPEVASGKPWSPAADVFSLGVTLRRALKRSVAEPEPLRKLLNAMVGPEPQRPLGRQLVAGFQDLLEREPTKSRKAWIQTYLGEPPPKFRPFWTQIEILVSSLRDGILPVGTQRLLWLSFILEQALGATVDERPRLKEIIRSSEGGTLLLKVPFIALHDREFKSLDDAATTAAGRLRNGFAHADATGSLRQACRDLGLAPQPVELRNTRLIRALGTVCQRLDEIAKTTTLGKIYALASENRAQAE